MRVELLTLLLDAMKKHGNLPIKTEESPYCSLAGRSADFPDRSANMLVSRRPNLHSWFSPQEIDICLDPVTRLIAQLVQKFISGNLPAPD